MQSRNVPTLSDVAKLAGVSVATASRALSNPDLVAERTREAVSRAAAACGYRPNLVARSLRKRRCDTILVLIPEIGNEFYPLIISGMESYARSKGFSIILGMTSNRVDIEHSYLDLLAAQRADGLVILDGGIDQLLKTGVNPTGPTVQVLECTCPLSMPAVRVDEHSIAEQAVAHLAGLGHRRIAHIAGSSDSYVATERLAGFHAAMAARQLPVADGLICRGDYTHDGGAAAMEWLLGSNQPPTAVFCANDSSAIGAIRACQARGFRVPEEVSIVGVDDTSQASLVQPALTTVRQPRAEIGTRAMELIIALIRKDRNVERQVILPTELVVRQSTAPPSEVRHS